jgi:hypothetical protein
MRAAFVGSSVDCDENLFYGSSARIKLSDSYSSLSALSLT